MIKNPVLIIIILLVMLPFFVPASNGPDSESTLKFQINNQWYWIEIIKLDDGTDILLHGAEEKNLSQEFRGENLFPKIEVRDNRFVISWNRFNRKNIDLCYYDSWEKKSKIIPTSGFNFISRPEMIFQGDILSAFVFKGNNSDNDDLFLCHLKTGLIRNLTRTPENEKTFSINQENQVIYIDTRTLYHRYRYQADLENDQCYILEREPIIRDPKQIPWDWNSVTLNTIIAFGDSITCGEMRMDDLEGELHPELAYLAKVQELLELYGETYIINLGKTATNTFHAVERMDEVFSISPAYFCLILYGTNDIGWNQFSAASSAENLEWICLNARSTYGMYPIISTVPPAKLWEPGVQVFKENNEALNARIIELANRNNIPYIDTYRAFFQHEEGWEACLEDIKGNHPSPLGHEIMAGLFAPKILELPPAQPKNIREIENNDNYIMVQWSENVEFDFDYCQIEFGFQANDLNRITRSTTNDFRFLNLPSNPLNLKIYFRIQAVDQDGNASVFSPAFSIEFNQ